MFVAVPKAMQAKYDEIAPLIISFCDEKLDEHYKTLCLHLLEKLCRKRPSPLLGGRISTWAAGIVYAIGTNNFIFDKSQPIHFTAEELTAPFGLASSTVGNKAAELRKMFNMTYMNPEWMLPHLVRSNPAIWLVQLNGFIVDIRDMPLEIQQLAVEKGIIPFLPGDQDDEL